MVEAPWYWTIPRLSVELGIDLLAVRYWLRRLEDRCDLRLLEPGEEPEAILIDQMVKSPWIPNLDAEGDLWLPAGLEAALETFTRTQACFAQLASEGAPHQLLSRRLWLTSSATAWHYAASGYEHWIVSSYGPMSTSLIRPRQRRRRWTSERLLLRLILWRALRGEWPSSHDLLKKDTRRLIREPLQARDSTERMLSARVRSRSPDVRALLDDDDGHAFFWPEPRVYYEWFGPPWERILGLAKTMQDVVLWAPFEGWELAVQEEIDRRSVGADEAHRRRVEAELKPEREATGDLYLLEAEVESDLWDLREREKRWLLWRRGAGPHPDATPSADEEFDDLPF